MIWHTVSGQDALSLGLKCLTTPIGFTMGADPFVDLKLPGEIGPALRTLNDAIQTSNCITPHAAIRRFWFFT